jgi:hypothetical protein
MPRHSGERTVRRRQGLARKGLPPVLTAKGAAQVAEEKAGVDAVVLSDLSFAERGAPKLP